MQTITPLPSPPWTEVLEFFLRRDPLQRLTRWAHTYGGRVRLRLGGQEVLLLSNPEDIREVLVVQQAHFTKPRINGTNQLSLLLGNGLLTSEGDFHRHQRLAVQPAFHHQRIAHYAETMVTESEIHSRGWQAGQTIDMAEEMQRLTLAIVGKTLFGAAISTDEAQMVRAALATSMMSSRRLGGPLLTPITLKLPLPAKRHFLSARGQLDDIILHIVAERRRAPDDRGDLLSMLLLTTDGEGMTDEQVRDEALTLFLAGHETTANALSWTWYLLAQHPEIAARLLLELVTVLGDRSPTIADIPQLVYTHQVISEAMRLYPPAWVMARQAPEGAQVRDMALEPGTIAIMSQYIVHHRADLYPDPERFDPARWTPEAKAARPKFAYFPFGGGPRLCIGEPFAWTEAVLVLATLARRWQPQLVAGHPIEMQPLVTLRPKYGVRMVLHPVV